MATARMCNYINHYPALVGRCSLLRQFRDKIYHCLMTEMVHRIIEYIGLEETFKGHLIHAMNLQLKYAT